MCGYESEKESGYESLLPIYTCGLNLNFAFFPMSSRIDAKQTGGLAKAKTKGLCPSSHWPASCEVLKVNRSVSSQFGYCQTTRTRIVFVLCIERAKLFGWSSRQQQKSMRELHIAWRAGICAFMLLLLFTCRQRIERIEIRGCGVAIMMSWWPINV